MNLEASVMCACWKQGTASPPPVPVDCVFLDEEGYLHVDDEKLETGLDRASPEAPARSRGLGSILSSWLVGAERPDGRSKIELFYEWRSTGACPHHDMVFSSEYIGRHSTVRAMCAHLSEAAAADPSYRDGRSLSTLLAEIPTTSSGLTPPDRAEEALKELLLFRTANRRSGDDFSIILDPIERIFRVSVEIGNPVRWY
jgi:hypothetical protein